MSGPGGETWLTIGDLVARSGVSEGTLRMWESRHDLWPGEVVLDPIESLDIVPGSSAPPGWPPPAGVPTI